MRSWPQPAQGTWKQKLAAKRKCTSPSWDTIGTIDPHGSHFRRTKWQSMYKAWQDRDINMWMQIIIVSTRAIWLSWTSTTQKHQHLTYYNYFRYTQRDPYYHTIPTHWTPASRVIGQPGLVNLPKPIMLILRQSGAQRINNYRVKHKPTETISPGTDMLFVDKAHRSWQA
jgi:hypothetical protein